MLLVFMNSSKEVWSALKAAIDSAGFTIKKIDIFDKQHGTFKQFASENTAGFDLVLHCYKSCETVASPNFSYAETTDSVRAFLGRYNGSLPTQVYLHVGRQEEIDYRMLYSEWLSSSLVERTELVDFAEFRKIAQATLAGPPDIETAKG